MKKWIVGLACVVLGVASVPMASAQILTFDFDGLAGNEATADSNSNDVNLTSSTISRGAGLTAAANANRFNATSWALTDIATAVSGDDYMEFTITPQSGYQFDVSSIYIQMQRSSTGPSGLALRSSVDGYASDLDSEKTVEDVTTTQNFTWTFSQANSAEAVTYRIYGWAESTSGSGGIGDGTGDDLIVYGTVSSAGLGVNFDKTSGFEVEQGSADAITATAAGGTEPYSYVWSSTLDGAYYTTNDNVFTILATAPIGDYSASVEATDASPASVSNSIDFSVITPPDYYGITIVTNNFGEGTVTTLPEGQAVEGATVTITVTPETGYRVSSVEVVDESLSSVTVSGTGPYTFTMPAAAVTVTVTFEVYAEPDALIDFEDYTGGYGSNDYSTAEVTFGMTNVYAGSIAGSDRFNGTKSGRFAHLRGGGLADMMQSVAFAQPISKINFWYANYGTDDSVTFKVQVSDDGITWTDVGETEYDPDSTTLVEGVIDTIPENMTYFQFVTVNGTAGQRVSIDDIGVYFGSAVFGVTFDKTTGFQIVAGSADAITATAANGTEPYSYEWNSSLDGAYYTTNDNVFTILATAPAGDYSATVVATDGDPASVTNSLDFSVVEPYAITIVTNNPEQGTVTTDPETEAIAGETVTVNVTANTGYRVATINVSDIGDLSGTTFTMPASAVTVTVTFEVYVAPDALVDFEDYTGTYASNDYVAAGVTWVVTNVYAGNTADDAKIDTTSCRFQNDRAGEDTPAMMTSSMFDQPINKINFWYANYGSNTGGMFQVQVGSDGVTWTNVGTTYAPESTTLVEGVIDVLPANVTYVRIVTTAGDPGRVNIDNIGFFFGEPTFSVTFDKANGFVVDEGTSDTVTATAANGEEPYGYSWSSTLGATYYTASSNVFTILDTAPLGSYSAEVIATESSTNALSVTNTINFTVATPGITNSITITPPAYGTVTTSPSNEAASGVTVTITATPSTGYQVDTVTVIDDDTNPVTVTNMTFVMPATGVTVNVTFSLIPTGAEIAIDGALGGNVNELLALTITLTNSATPATDWTIVLTDPTLAPVYIYSWDSGTGAFSFTPTIVGDYSLSVTALDSEASPIAGTNATLAVVTPSVNPGISNITFVAGTGFTFDVPTGYSLTRVEGAVTTLSGDAFDWQTLTAGTDYTFSDPTVTILSDAVLPSGYGRMIRIVVTAD